MFRLRPRLLTSARFAPFGDVIEAIDGSAVRMNEGRFIRFDDLCRIELDEAGRVAIGIARSRTAISLPYRFDRVERHPLGSQAFIPTSPCRFVVVVGPPHESIKPADLRAFVTNGRQGVNYRRNTWHMALTAFEVGTEFLVVDRVGETANCDELTLDTPVELTKP